MPQELTEQEFDRMRELYTRLKNSIKKRGGSDPLMKRLTKKEKIELGRLMNKVETPNKR